MGDNMKVYMKPRVEKENLMYAQILLQDFAGKNSEMTAINLYVYQHLSLFQNYPTVSKDLKEIAETEMHHLNLLGETIKLLGGDPQYATINCVTGAKIPWTAENVNYTDNLKEMILYDINSELQAITTYREHSLLINDKYVRQLLKEIIADEKEHVKIFRGIYALICDN